MINISRLKIYFVLGSLFFMCSNSFSLEIKLDDIFKLKNEEVITKLGPKVDALSAADMQDLYQVLKRELESHLQSMRNSRSWNPPPSLRTQAIMEDNIAKLQKLTFHTESKLSELAAKSVAIKSLAKVPKKIVKVKIPAAQLVEEGIEVLPNVFKTSRVLAAGLGRFSVT